MVVFLHIKVVFILQNVMIDKNNLFSYGYERIGDKWEIKYDDFVIQIVETTDNLSDLEKFSELIIDTKSIFLFMLISLIASLLTITILLANKLTKYHINPKNKNLYSFFGLIFAILFVASYFELMEHTRAIEYVFFGFPESPPYPK